MKFCPYFLHSCSFWIQFSRGDSTIIYWVSEFVKTGTEGAIFTSGHGWISTSAFFSTMFGWNVLQQTCAKHCSVSVCSMKCVTTDLCKILLSVCVFHEMCYKRPVQNTAQCLCVLWNVLQLTCAKHCSVSVFHEMCYNRPVQNNAQCLCVPWNVLQLTCAKYCSVSVCSMKSLQGEPYFTYGHN